MRLQCCLLWIECCCKIIKSVKLKGDVDVIQEEGTDCQRPARESWKPSERTALPLLPRLTHRCPDRNPEKIDPWIQLVPNLPGPPAGRSRNKDHRRDQNLPAGHWTAKKRIHGGLGFTNIEIKKEHLFRNKCLQSVRLNI